MKVRFWGTRGSIAKAGPTTVRYGGNTSCVEVLSNERTLIIIDCGTGAQGLGADIVGRRPEVKRGFLLISHTHWDHIQGMPFFAPLFVPGSEWDIYGPRGLGQSIRDSLAGQMQYTYFPITLEALGATIRYHDLTEGELEIGGVSVRTRYLNHPALTLGYRLEVDGSTLVYSCDHEPHSRELAMGVGEISGQDADHVAFLKGADLVIHDAQYTADEFASKVGWGHSTVEYAAAVCRAAGVKQLALTHHDPMRNDDQIDRLVADIRIDADGRSVKLDIVAATEGATIELPSRKPSVKPSAKIPAGKSAQTVPSDRESSVLIFSIGSDATKLLVSAAAADNLNVSVESGFRNVGPLVGGIKPSIVFVDGSQDVCGAIDLCNRIRDAKDAMEGLPIIVVAGAGYVASDDTPGVTDWLLQPFSLEYARTRIRAWIMRSNRRWIKAPLPEDDAERIDTLRRLAILDTDPDERLDRIT